MEERTNIGILDLPSNVTLHIFRFINLTDLLFVRRTCQQWYQLSREKSLWRTLKVADFTNHSFSPTSFLELIREIGESVESLYCDLSNHLLRTCSDVGNLCPNLKEICIENKMCIRKKRDIPSTDINNCLLMLSEKNSNLTKLQLVNLVLLHENIFSNLETFVYESFDSSVNGIRVLEFLQHHSKLKHITLRGCTLSVGTVTKLLTGYSQLETLDLAGSLFVQDEPNSVLSLEEMKVENLRMLNLNGADLADGLLQKIAKKAMHLEYINVASCPLIKNSAIEVVAKHCINLKTLIINEDEGNYSESGHCDITGVGIEMIAENCHFLTVLRMTDCPEVGDRSVAAIINGCPELVEFEVTGCLSLQDVTVLLLVKTCVKIRKLNLGNCPQLTGKSISSVLRYCKVLKYLDIETCNRVSNLFLRDLTSDFEASLENDKDLEAGAVKPEAVKEFSNHDAENGVESTKNKLHHKNGGKIEIDLDKANLLDHNFYGNSETLKVDIKNERRSNDIKFETVLSKSTDKNLKCGLNLSMQYLELLRNHSHVNVLNLSFCSGITNSCIKQIAWHCPDLRELDITACYMITNAGVLALVQNCKYLQSLNISGGSVTQTSRLTNDCLLDIGRYGKNLKKLIMQKNYNITVDGVQNLVQNCEEIHILCVEASTRSNLSKEILIDTLAKVKDKGISLVFKADYLVEIIVKKGRI